jgi:lysozyme
VNVRDLITKHEGVRLVKYADSQGHWTVGVGHNLDAMPLDPALWEDDAQTLISPATCDQLLSDDLSAATFAAAQNFAPWFQALDEVRQAVILDMLFNMGFATLRTFQTFLGMVSAGNYGAAADDMLHTLWAKQVGPRAIEDSEMMRSGLWPDTAEGPTQ